MAFDAEFQFTSKQWDDALGRLKKFWDDKKFRTDHGQELIGIISANVFADIAQHFESEEGPTGAWKPWSVAYAQHMARKPKKGKNKLLQDSGRLRNAFVPGKTSRVTADGIVFFNNAKVKGSGFPYAYAHNTGGPKLPQRKFMWLSNQKLSYIAGQVSSWLQFLVGG